MANVTDLHKTCPYRAQPTHAFWQRSISGRSRDEAYRIVQENAQRAWDTGTPFRELLGAAAPELDLDSVFDVAAYTRYVDAVLNRLDGLA